MSGHSKWHSIKHKKGANDAKRGAIFTRHGNLIAIAARQGGGDPEMNPALRLAIDNAKKQNMPNNNIERAIKKGTGEDKDGVQMLEITYEGYGPNGVAFLVNTLTDNRNRTVASIRSIFSKAGGSLGESGTVSFQFSNKGMIHINLDGNSDELQMVAIEAGAIDVSEDDDMLTVETEPSDLYAIADALTAAGADIESASNELIPSNTITLDSASAEKILNLIDTLEEDPDITSIAHNLDPSSLDDELGETET